MELQKCWIDCSQKFVKHHTIVSNYFGKKLNTFYIYLYITNIFILKMQKFKNNMPNKIYHRILKSGNNAF